MSKKTETANQLREILGHHPNIRLAILFGSLATDRAGRDSDLDIAISLGRPMTSEEQMALISELGERIGRPVDLIDLTRVGEPLLGQIIRHGRLLVGEKADYTKLKVRHLLDQADFVPYQQRLLAERRQKWIGH
ncbi:type VII toxin-antitoxin system MntA family adenylyltransferase antitoxin [Thiohalophilus sp.]|uniref:type VII toxin-antitoxin system MntA family adenylyltransferase antitoxin n=1 Tax=Thiohalophilus sp. TaxID=3028392 RepID=UPI002ACD5352|nr:nucleotidyltransferase domain-containing protein [Thiohalophilus sp.]MDZ7804369.1 nucleotidyltransferase domain-containing protein [Thiohalophilus sp.]